MTAEESKNSLQRMTLREFAEMEFTMVTENFAQEENKPLLAFIDEEGNLNIGVVPQYGNKALNSDLRTAMALVLKNAGATKYCFISEAWMVHRKEITVGISPAKEPDRMEVVSLLAVDISGERIVITAEIARDENGKRVAKRLPQEEGGVTEGPLANLFEGMTPEAPTMN